MCLHWSLLLFHQISQYCKARQHARTHEVELDCCWRYTKHILTYMMSMHVDFSPLDAIIKFFHLHTPPPQSNLEFLTPPLPIMQLTSVYSSPAHDYNFFNKPPPPQLKTPQTLILPPSPNLIIFLHSPPTF